MGGEYGRCNSTAGAEQPILFGSVRLVRGEHYRLFGTYSQCLRRQANARRTARTNGKCSLLFGLFDRIVGGDEHTPFRGGVRTPTGVRRRVFGMSRFRKPGPPPVSRKTANTLIESQQRQTIRRMLQQGGVVTTIGPNTVIRIPSGGVGTFPSYLVEAVQRDRGQSLDVAHD